MHRRLCVGMKLASLEGVFLDTRQWSDISTILKWSFWNHWQSGVGSVGDIVYTVMFSMQIAKLVKDIDHDEGSAGLMLRHTCSAITLPSSPFFKLRYVFLSAVRSMQVGEWSNLEDPGAWELCLTR